MICKVLLRSDVSVGPSAFFTEGPTDTSERSKETKQRHRIRQDVEGWAWGLALTQLTCTLFDRGAPSELAAIKAGDCY